MNLINHNSIEIPPQPIPLEPAAASSGLRGSLQALIRLDVGEARAFTVVFPRHEDKVVTQPQGLQEPQRSAVATFDRDRNTQLPAALGPSAVVTSGMAASSLSVLG